MQMLMMQTAATEGALGTLTAAVAAHRAGGDVSTRLQSDWSDGPGLPTIVVRIGNTITIKQGRTFHDAAAGLLDWVSRQAEPAR
jgi:hypothetical protein